MTITAAADGSALGNPGPAGWAWYIDDNTWRAGGWSHGTNNMGELKAVLDLLESTAAHPETAQEELLILCDSQYVINSVTKWMPGWKRKGWKKRDGKPVLNVELMQAIDAAIQGRQVHFEWVKGHAGHPMNEAADLRANAAAHAFQIGQPANEGPGLTGSTSAMLSEPTAPDVEATPNSASDVVISHELALLSERVRSDLALAAELLHPEMVNIDSAGRMRHREEFLQALTPLIGFDAIDPLSATDISAVQVHPGVFLIEYDTHGVQGTVKHTSLWLFDGEQWALRHHQATPVEE